MKIFENDKIKALKSPRYNYLFRKLDGFFMRWGQTQEDDPDFSPYGPEILDLEISTGACLGKCRFCYKENGRLKNKTQHMTINTFKHILDVMPNTLTQIALGLTNTEGNPDFWKIIDEGNKCGLIMNFTTHGLDITSRIAEMAAKKCGAVAVSIVDKEKSYNTIEMFTDAGMCQVNIHFMLSEETFEKAKQVVNDIAIDPRLKNLNAIVFLQFKSKGSGVGHFTSILSNEKYRDLIEECEKHEVSYGFDSCSAPLYLSVIRNHPNYDKLVTYVEPCESGLFSSYINCDGIFYACSFAEGMDTWIEGINVLECNEPDDFLNKVWYSKKVVNWRNRLLKNLRNCPMYKLGK